MVTATKASPENITISFVLLCNKIIISIRSTSTETANYPGTKLVGVAKFNVMCSVLVVWSFHIVVLQRTAKKCTKM